MIDPITEADLAAYVDGQLDAMRRLDVEAHLARHPNDAARIMADLRDRDALREAFAPLTGLGSDRLRDSARRIDRALAWKRVGARFKRAAVIALLVGAGWLAHTEIGTFGVPDTIAAPADPTLVDEARQAREAVLIRARTQSQPPSVAYDRDDLEAATGLKLPVIPGEWTVRDVQVFPARNGSAVEVTIDGGEAGDLSLFVTGRASSAVNGAAAGSADETTTYWYAGRTAYVLSGGKDANGLHAAALKLAMSR